MTSRLLGWTLSFGGVLGGALNRQSWRGIALAVTLVVVEAGATPSELQARAEQLKNCLSDFGGIVWQYPYAPPLHTYRCASPAAGYVTSPSADSARKLELISNGGFEQLEPDGALHDDYSAVHEAVYRHFDTLFSRQGFKREPPLDAQTPLERHARYTRRFGGNLQTLTFESNAGNTWNITFEGLPDAPAAERRP